MRKQNKLFVNITNNMYMDYTIEIMYNSLLTKEEVFFRFLLIFNIFDINNLIKKMNTNI